MEGELSKWDKYIGDEDSNFIVGSSVTIVDLSLFPLLVTLAAYNQDFRPYPHLNGYYKAFSSRQTVQKTWPSVFKGVTHSVFR